MFFLGRGDFGDLFLSMCPFIILFCFFDSVLCSLEVVGRCLLLHVVVVVVAAVVVV